MDTVGVYNNVSPISVNTQVGTAPGISTPSTSTASRNASAKNSVPDPGPAAEPEFKVLEGKIRNGEPLSISEKAVYEAIEKANKAVEGISTYFKFSVHEKTKEIVVKVVNQDTNEVIREIPPEKVLDMVAKMWELAGLFVDERR